MQAGVASERKSVKDRSLRHECRSRHDEAYGGASWDGILFLRGALP